MEGGTHSLEGCLLNHFSNSFFFLSFSIHWKKLQICWFNEVDCSWALVITSFWYSFPQHLSFQNHKIPCPSNKIFSVNISLIHIQFKFLIFPFFCVIVWIFWEPASEKVVKSRPRRTKSDHSTWPQKNMNAIESHWTICTFESKLLSMLHLKAKIVP